LVAIVPFPSVAQAVFRTQFNGIFKDPVVLEKRLYAVPKPIVGIQIVPGIIHIQMGRKAGVPLAVELSAQGKVVLFQLADTATVPFQLVLHMVKMVLDFDKAEPKAVFFIGIEKELSGKIMEKEILLP